MTLAQLRNSIRQSLPADTTTILSLVVRDAPRGTQVTVELDVRPSVDSGMPGYTLSARSIAALWRLFEELAEKREVPT